MVSQKKKGEKRKEKKEKEGNIPVKCFTFFYTFGLWWNISDPYNTTLPEESQEIYFQF